MANSLLFSIIVFIVLLIFNPEMEEGKRFLILLVIAIAIVLLVMILYDNFTDYEPQPQIRSSYSQYTYPSTSPFHPKTEEQSKWLLREASEQLDSHPKSFVKKPTFSYDNSVNLRDSSITRRRPEYSRREETSPYGRAVSPAMNTSSVFHQFNQPQSMNRTTISSRNVKDVPIPKTFTFGGRGSGSPTRLNESTRYGFSMYDTNPRKGNDYAYSSSPIRNNPSIRNQYERSFDYFGGKSFIDEQFGSSGRESLFSEAAEKAAWDLIVKLGIQPEFPDWKNNCQRWFAAKLIPRILDRNISNIKELNRIIGYFDKRLHEYEYILKMDQGRTTENITQKPSSPIINNISIDELLSYETSFKNGGPVWLSSHLSSSDVNRAHQDLVHLMQTRRQLEKYFEIEGFRAYEVRTYILERLFQLKENIHQLFKYNTERGKKRYPTDTQILANLFFTFLNVENAIQTEEKDQVYRNFVFRNNTNTIPSHVTDEDVYFRQSNADGEPHYDIISGKQIWPAYPGKDNLFWAIVLFVYHIKCKKHGTLGSEESRIFKEFLQTVIP